MALTQVQPGMLGTPQPNNFKNRIINGAMVIDQRNAGASVTGNNGTYAVDRFRNRASVNSKFTTQQNAGSVTPPVGFVNYLGCTSSSAYSVGASELFTIAQSIEGYNVADLGWGTANAKTVTLSFWVYSSLTGTFGGAVNNSGNSRSYPFTYTISSANTWEQKSITIAGDTTGTWLKDNSTGIQIQLSLGAGSSASGTAGAWAGANYASATGATSVVGTNGATFYITGVQLEVGSTATEFDYRPYGTELMLCQRYYYKQINYMGQSSPYNAETSGARGTSVAGVAFMYRVSRPHPVQMRATPTVSYANIQIWDGVVQVTVNSIQNNNSTLYARSLDYAMSGNGGGSGLTAAEFLMPSGYIDCSAEL